MSANGNDANDGLSAGSAKATIAAAISSITSGTVYLASGVYQVTSELIIPPGVRLVGQNSGNNQTTINASGLSSGVSVVSLGSATYDGGQGGYISDVAINCENESGVVGLSNNFLQEQSGARHITINDCPGGALQVGTTGSSLGGAQNSGPYEDININETSACTNCSTGTVPVSVSAASVRGITGLTINASSATHPTVAANISSSTRISDAHCEGAVSCYSLPTAGVLVNSNCGASTSSGAVTNCVLLPTGSFTVLLGGIYNIGNVTNILSDIPDGITIPAASLGTLGIYSNGTPSLGSTFSGISLLSSGGGSITHKAPNTAAAVTVTEPVATTLTPVVGTCTMTTTTCTVTVVSGATHCIVTDNSASHITGGCAISGTTLTVTAASSNTDTWAVLWW